MTERPILFLSSLILAALSLACSRQPVIASVDMEKVISESAVAKKVISEVEVFARSAEEQVNKAGQQMQAASQKPGVSPEKIEGMKQQFSQMYGQAQEEVNRRREEAEAEVHKRLNDAIKELAKEKGWDMVVMKDARSPIWVDETLDQTAAVIKKMDSAK